MELDHERLDVYRLALGVARWAAKQSLPACRSHLREEYGDAVAGCLLLHGGDEAYRM